MKNCEDASVFLDRAKYPLLPQDFAVTEPVEGSGFGNIKELFERLRHIWSFLYLANSAYIVNEKAILQFDPAGAAEEYEFEELVMSSEASRIYNWVYKDDGCVDKASIARKQFEKLRCWMIGLWIVMIIILGIFPGFLFMSANSTKEAKNINNCSESEIAEVSSTEDM